MSGALVGEIIDACEHGLTLSPGEKLALITIAEKCHEASRTGSVRMTRIQAAMGRSHATAKRAVRSLKDRGIIGVVRYGYSREGTSHASVYVIYDPSAWVTQDEPCRTTQHGSKPGQHGSFEPSSMAQIGVSMAHPDDPHDGSYMTELHDGVDDGSRSASRRSTGDEIQGRAVRVITLCSAAGCDQPADIWNGEYCEDCYAQIRGLR